VTQILNTRRHTPLLVPLTSSVPQALSPLSHSRISLRRVDFRSGAVLGGRGRPEMRSVIQPIAGRIRFLPICRIYYRQYGCDWLKFADFFHHAFPEHNGNKTPRHSRRSHSRNHHRPHVGALLLSYNCVGTESDIVLILSCWLSRTNCQN
jgi:hypothetical protein